MEQEAKNYSGLRNYLSQRPFHAVSSSPCMADKQAEQLAGVAFKLLLRYITLLNRGDLGAVAPVVFDVYLPSAARERRAYPPGYQSCPQRHGDADFHQKLTIFLPAVEVAGVLKSKTRSFQRLHACESLSAFCVDTRLLDPPRYGLTLAEFRLS